MDIQTHTSLAITMVSQDFADKLGSYCLSISNNTNFN